MVGYGILDTIPDNKVMVFNTNLTDTVKIEDDIICAFWGLFFFFKSRLPYQVEKKGGCVRGWCVRRGSLLQDRLPAKSQHVNFKDPKCKHEIFVRIDMKHSYFSNDFIICLQSNCFCC